MACGFGEGCVVVVVVLLLNFFYRPRTSDTILVRSNVLSFFLGLEFHLAGFFFTV